MSAQDTGLNKTAESLDKLDAKELRRQFPLLATRAHGQPLVYLDNAATTQKPQRVIDALLRYYNSQNANIHRGVYDLSQTATGLYEATRQRVARFINAAEPREIIFTRGTTESINLVAASWGRATLGPGDEVLLSRMEHHSNIVPWQMICQQTGAILRVVPFNKQGELDLGAYRTLLSERTRLVSIVHSSNALGTINPVAEIIALAHALGAKVLIDGAQWVAHGETDVQALDVDFYAFSGHKIYGPTGIGVLYGKLALLEQMPPYQGGGDMIASVTFEKTTYAAPPSKFEAGTPHMAGVIGLAHALDFLSDTGLERIAAHEADLLAYATAKMTRVPGLRLIGTAAHKAGVLSFVLEDPPLASLDIGTKLDLKGIAVRTGHHCCQPTMEEFGIASTTRASLAAYNTREDIDRLVAALEQIVAEARTRHAAIVPPPDSHAAEYPAASAATVDAAAQEIAEVFEFLGEWKDRYQYLVELGEKLPSMPAGSKTDEHRVRGCQSTVHLVARAQPGSVDVLEFLADSDADIVRGLIGLLEKLFSGQKAGAVLAFDVDGFFAKVGLDQHLSMTRRNGLYGMVQRIRQHARQIVAAKARS
jgi:cysteine desulfurase/selenocysteine lyase